MTETTSTAGAKGAPDTWFLKIDADNIFGPANIGELLSWAEQGRIVPGNELSQDKQKWVILLEQKPRQSL